MADWQVTAATMECRNIAAEVTIVVKNDWSVKCTGRDELAASRQASIELVKRTLALKRTLDCKGIGCSLITAYVQKLQDEEHRKTAPVA